MLLVAAIFAILAFWLIPAVAGKMIMFLVAITLGLAAMEWVEAYLRKEPEIIHEDEVVMLSGPVRPVKRM